MKMILFILDHNTRKTHKRVLPYRSCEVKAHTTRTGKRFLFVSDYYTGELIKRVSINKYGSCSCWVESKEQ